MDENTKELIKVRLEKAEEDIETARELLSLKRYRAAVNRSYYAMFSITTAVLLTKKLERSKHSGVQAAFNHYFIKNRIIEIEYGKIFDYVRKKREECDYTAKCTIDRETARKIVKDSRKFIKRMMRYLYYDRN
ncbi:MAG TPA: HEPN domain-containing protein [Nitrospirae bacterium]|nr:HEPN domain-containing protein [Nitrospirota bacterium]HDK16739.1 HEPN domain-containing protein [Nitrospirota bacterium]